MKRAARWLLAHLFPLGIPLPWRQLASSRGRFLAAMAGVAMATTLMLFQLGIHEGLIGQVSCPISALRCDLVMVSPQSEYFYATTRFTRRRLYQALALPDVASVVPLYVGILRLKNPTSFKNKESVAIAFDPSQDAYLLPEVDRGRPLLHTMENVLYDELASPELGPIPQLFRDKGEVRLDIDNRVEVKVKGLFRMGNTLAFSSHMVMGDQLYFRVFSDTKPGMINIGLIRLRPGVERGAAARRIAAALPNDVRVLTKEEYAHNETDYWSERTPVGFVVTAGMLVAMVIGALIVYQILFSDVNSHLGEYATLKAVGFGDGFFVKLVVQQSLILMLAGFGPGLLAADLLYWLAREATYMPIFMSFGKAVLVFVLAFLACLASGLLATRELRTADPAEIF